MVDFDGGSALAGLPVFTFLEIEVACGRRGAWGWCCENAAGEKGEGEDGLSEHVGCVRLF